MGCPGAGHHVIMAAGFRRGAALTATESKDGLVSYSLALDPFYPAWRGPQRLLLRLDGERIIDIEYRDEYNERGCAERLTRLDLPQALHLVTRICGTCSCAHSLAFCQA